MNLGVMILLASFSASNFDFESQRLTYPNAQPWSEYQQNLLLEKARSFELTKLFSEARSLELGGDSTAATKTYRRIANLRFDADWTDADRQVIYHSLLKLSQYATTDALKSAHMQDADGFGGDLKAETLRSQTIVKNLRLQKVSVVLINGRPFQVGNSSLKISLPPGQFRMTLLSNWSEPYARVLDRAEFLNLNPKLKSVVLGDCKKGFSLSSNMDHQIFQASSAKVVDANCVSDLRQPGLKKRPIDNTWIRAEQPKSSIQKIPSWIWWGLGIIGGYALYEQQRSEGSSGPTTRRGF